ncbi:MAG: hypothetical protein ACYCOU_24800, partial [Sulfobacillus sp.]
MTQSFVEARALLLSHLEKDLVGPHDPQEQLTEHPGERYLLGYLYAADDPEPVDVDEPQSTLVAPDDGETVDDEATVWSGVRKNRAFGLTCQIHTNARLR